ncbi:MAG: hypothetical protein IKL97_07355 [Eggerthellaceae bacterium]|nr:hypothetical protein [Eggerthellaceae bacterium]
MNEIERTWNEEVREKKRAASGVHGKKGKRGYVGTMRTPVDLMTSAKERRAYEGTTPVKSSIVDPPDALVPHDEFKKMSRQEKILLLYKLRSKYSAKAIADAWGVSDKTLYYYYRAYGISRDNSSSGAVADDGVKEKASGDSSKEAALEAISATDSESDSPTGEASKNECLFKLAGIFEAEALGKKLNGLAFMLDDKLKYQVEIHVKELVE